MSHLGSHVGGRDDPGAGLDLDACRAEETRLECRERANGGAHGGGLLGAIRVVQARVWRGRGGRRGRHYRPISSGEEGGSIAQTVTHRGLSMV
jgi:hypothetical protein